MRRVLGLLLALILSLVVVAVPLLVYAVVWVAATDTGTQFAWQRARALLPAGISVADLEGRLAGRLTVKGLEVKTDSLSLKLARFELDWHPEKLLTDRTLDIERIALQGLDYTQLASAPPAEPEPESEPEPFKLPEQIQLPIRVRLGKVSIDQVQYRAAPQAEPLIVNSALLQAHADADGVTVTTLTVDAPLFDLDGRTRLQTHSDYALRGAFHWRVRPPDYAPVDGQTTLGGSLQKAVQIHQSLAAPYSAQADVAVREPLGELGFKAVLKLQSVDLQKIGKDLPPMVVHAEAHGRGDPEDIRFDVNSRVKEPTAGTVQADLKGRFASQILTIDALNVALADTPARLTAQGTVDLNQDQPDLDVNAEWQQLRWPPAGQVVLVSSPRGTADVKGSLKDLMARLDVQLGQGEHAGHVNANGRFDLAAKQPMLDLKADWQGLRWPMQGAPMVTSPQGKLEAEGTPEDLKAQLAIAVGDDGRIKGHANRAGDKLDVALDWQRLQWPLTQPRVKTPQGRVAVTGTMSDYKLDVDARVDVPEQTDGHIRLAGQGSLESLDLKTIDIKALKGTLQGNAKVAWKPAIKGMVKLEGQGLDPGVLIADWPGKLGLTVEASGGMEGDAIHAEVDTLKAEGRLRGNPIQADVKGGYGAGGAAIQEFVLRSGSTRLQASGQVNDRVDVNWQLESQDLGSLLPAAQGRISGKGSANGPLMRPHVRAALSADGLKYQDNALESLKLDADVDLSGASHSELSLALNNGQAAGVELRHISLEGSGDASSHQLTLQADTSSGQVDMALSGKLNRPWQPDMAWDFTLAQATLEYPDLDAWSLARPAKGQVTAQDARLSRACWQSHQASLCLQGARTSQGIDAEFSLDQLPFTYFAHFLPPDIRMDGQLSGQGSFSQPASGQPTAKVNLKTTPGKVVSNADEAAKTVLEFKAADIGMAMQQGGLSADVKLPLSARDGLELSARVPPGADSMPMRPLNGRINAHIQNIDFIADLVPEIQHIEGRLIGNVDINGTLQAPALRGRLALENGAAKLDGPGLAVKDIGVELTGQGDGPLKLAAHASSGGGMLNMDGSADLTGQAPTADIRIHGQDFRVVNTAETTAYASPDMKIAVREQRIDVNGEVRIPKANIQIKELPPSAVTTSGDVVIAKPGEEQPEQTAIGRKLHARVRLILGKEDTGGKLVNKNKVHFEGFGLKANFEGELLAVEEPGQTTTGSGELDIKDGEYRAYGQGLVIERGRVLFAGGPISQPGLDVRAVRRPEEGILVGVKVRGTLKQPEFTLFSEPGMTQGNQLSYLVLGRPLEGASDSEGSALSRAALALGLKGTDTIAGKIGGKLGLDQFGLQTTEAGSSSTPEQAAFVIGKYLSPKLYVSYGVGLFEPVSTVKLQYSISSNWKLESESSTNASGGDLIYTIETGQ